VSQDTKTVYTYTDPTGTPVYTIIRSHQGGKKTFRAYGPDGVSPIGDVQRVPYRLDTIADAPAYTNIFVVEGEKDVDRLHAEGFTATSNPFGAGHWSDSYSEYLRDRSVILLPDNDDVGRAHMGEVAKSLRKYGCRTKIVQLPGLLEKGDVSDWLDQGHTLDDLIGEALEEPWEEPNPPDTPPATHTKIRWLNFNQLDSQKPPAWLIDKVILTGGSVAMLVGAFASGKSFLAVDWALSVSQGRSWFGRAVRPGPVCYIAAEGSWGISLRARAWAKKRAIHDIQDFFLCPDSIAFLEAGMVDQFIAALPCPNPALIVVDTLARCIVGGDENSSHDMGILIESVSKVAKRTGATVLLVHHSGWQGGRSRGSTVLPGGMDTIISIEDTDGTFTVQSRKQKDGDKMEPMSFNLTPVTLIMNSDPGEITGSCVLELATQAADARNLSFGQRRVLETLCSPMMVNTTKRDLAGATGLDESELFSVLDKLGRSGLITYRGWPKTGTQRFSVTEQGAEAVGRTAPTAQEQEQMDDGKPWWECLCGVTAWVHNEHGQWTCSGCGSVIEEEEAA
jgi:AAA domain-containing protein